MHQPPETAITFTNLCFAYGPKAPAVLQGYSATVARGRIFAILGPNGRGKSTLLRLLLGSLKARNGECRVQGTMAFVPQLFQVSFPYRVLDMVVMGRARHVGLFSTPSRADEGVALEALSRLGLVDLAERPFDELSGGQRQLVIFARALASGADILVLDEPTSALDLKNQAIVLEWVDRLSRQDGLTVVFTTHHPHHALAVADEALLMLGPDAYACGPTDDVLTEDNLHRLYGVEMRRLAFAHHGEAMAALVPVYPGLRKSA